MFPSRSYSFHPKPCQVYWVSGSYSSVDHATWQNFFNNTSPRFYSRGSGCLKLDQFSSHYNSTITVCHRAKWVKLKEIKNSKENVLEGHGMVFLNIYNITLYLDDQLDTDQIQWGTVSLVGGPFSLQQWHWHGNGMVVYVVMVLVYQEQHPPCCSTLEVYRLYLFHGHFLLIII